MGYSAPALAPAGVQMMAPSHHIHGSGAWNMVAESNISSRAGARGHAATPTNGLQDIPSRGPRRDGYFVQRWQANPPRLLRDEPTASNPHICFASADCAGRGGDEITIQSQAPQRPKPSRGSCLGRIRMVGRALIRCVHHFHGSFLLARSGGPCAKDLRSGKEGDLAPEGRGGGRDLESPQIIM